MSETKALNILVGGNFHTIRSINVPIAELKKDNVTKKHFLGFGFLTRITYFINIKKK